MERLNIFNPFRHKSHEHEDRLTWAFLVVLKYDPLLQNFLREMVLAKAGLPLEDSNNGVTWEPAVVSTQTKRIENTPALLISVLLTDKSLQKEVEVKWSDREAIYDGVVEYPNGLTLIIENKLRHVDVCEEQLSPSKNSFPEGDIKDVKLHESAICLEWAEVLEGMLRYAYSSVAPFGSRENVHDFLSLVDEDHPDSELTPYRTFALCGDRPEALKRRIALLVDALKEKGGDDLEREYDRDKERRWWYLRRPDKIAERVALLIPDLTSKPLKLRMSMWPANIVGQAKRFYKAVDKKRFLNLTESDEWKIESDLHFSFIGTKLVWAETKLETEAYFDLAADGLAGRRDVDSGLPPLLDSWEHKRLISSETKAKIKVEFLEKNRDHINVIPGFHIYREWDLEEVIELEKKGELEKQILDSLARALATWGETL